MRVHIRSEQVRRKKKELRFVKKKKKLNEWNLNPVLVEREMGGKSGFEQHHSHGRDGVLSRGVSKSKSNINK